MGLDTATSGTPTDITAEEAAQYDRQIRLWGMDAQRKYASAGRANTRIRAADVLLLGLNALSSEVCKNLVLAGVRSLTLSDDKLCALPDLGGEFFLRREDLHKPKAACYVPRVQALNPRVKVLAIVKHVQDFDQEQLEKYNVVCLVTGTVEVITKINTICNARSIKFWASDCLGWIGFIFSDLGLHTFKENTTKSVENADSSFKQIQYKSFENSLEAVSWGNINKRKLKKISPLFSYHQFPSNASHLYAFAIEFAKVSGLNQSLVSMIDIERLIAHSNCKLTPVCAIVGGVLSQEVLRGISESEQPMNNFLVFDGINSTDFIVTL